MRVFHRHFGLLLLLLWWAGCSSDAEAPAGSYEAAEEYATESLKMDAAQAPAPSSPPGTDTDLPATGADRMIVRTANMELVVADVEEALRRLTRMAETRGGYVSGMERWEAAEQIHARLTLRFPATALDSVTAQARTLALRVLREQVNAQDVTEEYTDLSARLRNLQATEEELRQLLATVRQRAQRAADILEVHRELTQIREQIERIQGRMQFIAQQTALSTLHVYLTTDRAARPVVEPGWRPLVQVRAALRALVGTMQWMVEGVIWLVLYVLPLLLVAGLVVFYAGRFIRRRRRGSS